MITVRTDTPWMPSAIMKVFKKGAFSKTYEIKFGKVRRAVGKEPEVSWYRHHQRTSFIPQLESPLRPCKACWEVVVIPRCEGWSCVPFPRVLLLSNRVPSSVPGWLGDTVLFLQTFIT